MPVQLGIDVTYVTSVILQQLPVCHVPLDHTQALLVSQQTVCWERLRLQDDLESWFDELYFKWWSSDNYNPCQRACGLGQGAEPQIQQQWHVRALLLIWWRSQAIMVGIACLGFAMNVLEQGSRPMPICVGVDCSAVDVSCMLQWLSYYTVTALPLLPITTVIAKAFYLLSTATGLLPVVTREH